MKKQIINEVRQLQKLAGIPLKEYWDGPEEPEYDEPPEVPDHTREVEAFVAENFPNSNLEIESAYNHKNDTIQVVVKTKDNSPMPEKIIQAIIDEFGSDYDVDEGPYGESSEKIATIAGSHNDFREPSGDSPNPSNYAVRSKEFGGMD